MLAIRSKMKWGRREQCPDECRMVFSRCHHAESGQYTHEIAAQHHSISTGNIDKHVANPQYTLTHNQTRVCGESEIWSIHEYE